MSRIKIAMTSIVAIMSGVMAYSFRPQHRNTTFAFFEYEVYIPAHRDHPFSQCRPSVLSMLTSGHGWDSRDLDHLLAAASGSFLRF